MKKIKTLEDFVAQVQSEKILAELKQLKKTRKSSTSQVAGIQRLERKGILIKNEETESL